MLGLNIKSYLWIALGLCLLAGGSYWTIHERHVGKAELTAVQTKLNAAVEKTAEIQEIPIGRTYEKIITSPAIANTGLVCHSTTVQSQTPDYRPESPGTTAQVPAGGFDPSGPILTLLRDSDAQIDGLINTVGVLQTELAAK